MSDNLKGALLMIASMAAFAVEDVLIKLTAGTLGAGLIILAIGAGGAVAFGIAAETKGDRVFSAVFFTRPVLIRTLFDVVATVCFVTALARTPLSLLTAVIQATPLAVTLWAALFMGAQVGWRRWTAILIGLFGVLLIVKPGASEFDPNTIWAIAAMLGLAGRDLATRATPKTVSSMLVGTWGLAALVPVGAAMIWLAETPPQLDLGNGLILTVAIITGLTAYYCIIEAMRTGDVAVVTPFRYSRLLFGLLFAIVIFGERPDIYTLIGAAIILAAGLYTLLRETR